MTTKTISRPLDYEKRLDKARTHAADGAEAMGDAKSLLASLRKDVLGRRSQQELLDHTQDAMVAAEHVRVTKERLEETAKAAKAVKADASAIADEADHLLWGIDAHYEELLAGQIDLGPVITEPPKKTRKAGAADKTIEVDAPDEGAAPPLRMPRGLGFLPSLLELIEADAPGETLTLEVLGYRLAKRAGEGCESEIPDMIAAASANPGQPPALTDAERAAFKEGVKRAIAEMETAEAGGDENAEPCGRCGQPSNDHDGDRCRSLDDDTTQAPEQAQGAAPCRAPRDVPGVDAVVLAAHDDPDTFREFGKRFARGQYIIGDAVDRVLTGALIALDDDQNGPEFEMTVAEGDELEDGIREGIAIEEAKVRGEEPPTAPDPVLSIACPRCKAPKGQGCTNYKGKGQAPHGDRTRTARALGALIGEKAQQPAGPGLFDRETAHRVYLDKARDLAKQDAPRQDGGRFRTADELWTSAAFAAPPELEPSKALFFEAYRETYDGAAGALLEPKSKKPGRRRKGTQS
jgi:hypothetical protein